MSGLSCQVQRRTSSIHHHRPRTRTDVVYKCTWRSWTKKIYDAKWNLLLGFELHAALSLTCRTCPVTSERFSWTRTGWAVLAGLLGISSLPVLSKKRKKKVSLHGFFFLFYNTMAPALPHWGGAQQSAQWMKSKAMPSRKRQKPHRLLTTISHATCLSFQYALALIRRRQMIIVWRPKEIDNQLKSRWICY